MGKRIKRGGGQEFCQKSKRCCQEMDERKDYSAYGIKRVAGIFLSKVRI